MPANRFYCEGPILKTTLIEGTEHHHLAHVMRCVAGDQIELVNGQGALGIGTIVEVGKKTARLQIDSIAQTPPPSFQLFLSIPLMRPSKLEWIVEKGTELGVHTFLFYRAVHSEKGELSSHQLERLRTLSISALKQSGRLYIPSFELHPSLSSLFNKEAQYLFGDLAQTARFNPSLLNATTPVVFISGPEQGFAPQEVALLQSKATGVRLNPYVLRAETAPIAAASILIGTVDRSCE